VEVLVAVSYRQLLLYGMLVPRIASTTRHELANPRKLDIAFMLGSMIMI
jgi:hypothetical protein